MGGPLLGLVVPDMVGCCVRAGGESCRTKAFDRSLPCTERVVRAGELPDRTFGTYRRPKNMVNINLLCYPRSDPFSFARVSARPVASRCPLRTWQRWVWRWGAGMRSWSEGRRQATAALASPRPPRPRLRGEPAKPLLSLSFFFFFAESDPKL